ncbi:hypothetical protein [Aurantiacibacter sediminis]|uniref:DUF4145 domain-containing protein n=1 Tax=Aurantiacibacter sediminis TaxID=2793064 RepID=A0ABS0MZI4_9SPHN|nr:hypothetical protein [Aurantiacibacter sediminis]MBH5321125.1 hypothetical protein [Aurantiacibacter sediminis]
MDLTEIIHGAIEDLPAGDFMPGLRSIQRHIAVAIKHFEREDDGELDSCTDAIYRCNQAFEGGLKEAYRVLAGKDPSKLTPFKIEEYLEKEKLIRPRALKQLTRYREDYRNPSTHDYKLDFDADEALLAIVSVSAFTKLLVNQIAGKIAFDAGKSSSKKVSKTTIKSVEQFGVFVAEFVRKKLGESPEFEASDRTRTRLFLDGALNGAGIETQFNLDPDEDEEEDFPWNSLAFLGEYVCPLEVRYLHMCSVEVSFAWVKSKMVEDGLTSAVLVFYENHGSTEYRIAKHEIEGVGHIQVVYPSELRKNLREVDRKPYEELTVGD